ncbi:MAG: HD domain-containing protein, partial [Nocardioides sp.]
PPSAARLGRMGAPLAQPWPAEARHLLVRLLAGSGLLGVWETLEETGALDALLPEWERIRLLPHASAIHRFTVDRHVIETCLEAGRLIRQVTRPDLLLVAALLHDIGKGGEGSHSIEGEAIARRVSRRMGFGEADAAEIARLVRWHLLLGEVATTRDLEDPATASLVAERLGSEETLGLLRTLTEADARAASSQAWTAWRARLIDELVRRVRPLLADSGGVPIADPPRRRVVPDPVRRSVGAAGPALVEADRPEGSPPLITVTPSEEGALVRVSAPDRVGLLADIAAALAWQRCGIRSARAWSEGELGASEWQLDDAEPDARLLRHHFEGIVAGRLDPGARLLRPTGGGLPPLVLVHPEASARATVIEVRAADRQGLLYAVLSALTRARLAISSAHITTIGPQAVDVFYVQEPGGESLSARRASAAADAIRAALVGS